ncbi:MAG: hypothetical protein ACLQGP_06545 [Isosphaeraceae bacterium]
MNTTCHSVVEVLGDAIALMTRQERTVWSLHDTDADILSLAQGRFKGPAHINHSLSQLRFSVHSLIEILAEGWVDEISNPIAGRAGKLRPGQGARKRRISREGTAKQRRSDGESHVDKDSADLTVDAESDYAAGPEARRDEIRQRRLSKAW